MRRRSPDTGSRNDDGATMILVVIVTTLCMIYVTASAVAATSGIRPARATADSMAALAAAQAGVDILTLAVQQCESGASGCAAISGTTPVAITPADGSASRATYAWKIIGVPGSGSSVLRMEVTGTVRTSSRVLVADFRNTPTALAAAYVTELETLGADVVNTYYGPRTVALTTSTVRAKAGISGTSTALVTWSGAQGTDICERPWYDTTLYGEGRSTLRGLRGLGTSGVDYTERVTKVLPTPPASLPSRTGACEVAYGTEFQAADTSKVYSKDALLLSRTVPAGAGPYFAAPVLTEWGPGAKPEPVAPIWYRVDGVGGAPAAGSQSPAVSAGNLALPTPVTDRSASTCVFTGPTRINLAGSYAYVTSPGTPSPVPATTCAGSQDTSLSGSGLLNFRIPITATTSFYVKDGTATGAAGPTSPLFNNRTITVGPPAASNQPGIFYSASGRDEQDIKDVVLAAPFTTPLHTALNTWLAGFGSTLGGTPYQAIAVSPAVPPVLPAVLNPADTLYEASRAVARVQRRSCALIIFCSWVDAFTVTQDSRTFPMAQDVTLYQNAHGTAFVDGYMTGRLTVAAQRDVVVTGNITTGGGTNVVGLVAGNGTSPGSNVDIYHPVRCAVQTRVTNPGETCPDDLTGLTAPLSYLDADHPSKKYVNLYTPGKLDFIYMDALVLASDGCLCLQNFMRGAPMLGDLTISGAIFQRHHGELGDYYGTMDTRSGYKKLYLAYSAAALKPPTLFAADSGTDTVTWEFLGVAEKQ